MKQEEKDRGVYFNGFNTAWRDIKSKGLKVAEDLSNGTAFSARSESWRNGYRHMIQTARDDVRQVLEGHD